MECVTILLRLHIVWLESDIWWYVIKIFSVVKSLMMIIFQTLMLFLSVSVWFHNTLLYLICTAWEPESLSLGSKCISWPISCCVKFLLRTWWCSDRFLHTSSSSCAVRRIVFTRYSFCAYSMTQLPWSFYILPLTYFFVIAGSQVAWCTGKLSVFRLAIRNFRCCLNLK